MRYAKLDETGRIKFAPSSMTEEERAQGGYLPYEEREKPETPENIIPHNYKPVYVEENGKIIRDWEAYPNFSEIERLKRKLAESDYKVIKCYEYSLAGLPEPYSIENIHTERQQIRDEINRLEACE